MTQALGTSRQIGVAIGILMNVHKVREDEGFALLRRSSQHLNRKVCDVATTVTETAALPESPGPTRPPGAREQPAGFIPCG